MRFKEGESVMYVDLVDSGNGVYVNESWQAKVEWAFHDGGYVRSPTGHLIWASKDHLYTLPEATALFLSGKVSKLTTQHRGRTTNGRCTK